MVNQQVKNIVRGSFTSFQSMYKPSLQEFAAEGLLQIPSAGHEFEQVSSFPEVLANDLMSLYIITWLTYLPCS